MSPRTPRRPTAQQSLKAPPPPPPLAARMRPRHLDEYIGQAHIIGHGRLLRRAIEADRLGSLIFHGPPGTGKTTLAQVIAGTTRARFTALNAVLAGVKDIREAVEEARQRRDLHSQRTLLFVDEVHRFNKSQQDALLPWVENGTVVLIGATTENPYFEVNKALVSRSRVFQLQSLTPDDLRQVIHQALLDPERGYGTLDVALAPEAEDHLVNVANGDARAALNALELAVETTTPDADGVRHISLAVAEESIQIRAVLYDKEGDAHFDTISAFIKSVRGSDPDAALYWLARMVYAGEDPRYIFRRLVILASEDIGLADPQALGVVMSCAQAFDRVGLPEGRFHLSQATLYLAATDKSNSTMAFFDAIKSVAAERADDVPNHLKDGNRDKEGFGHGEGYQYPHAHKEHWVAQQYLPTSLKGRVFWQPSTQGWEGEVGTRVARQREAQLAAMLEGVGLASVERLTTGPDDPRMERWLQRTAGRFGQRLAMQRDAIFAQATPQRHELVLDCEPGSGLLTWEALRQVPEGGVWSWTANGATADMLRGLAERLPELQRPHVLHCEPADLISVLGDVRVDIVTGRDALVQAPDAPARMALLRDTLLPEGRVVLVENLARHTPRLSAVVLQSDLPEGIHEAWALAEEALYTDMDDPLTRWTVDALVDVVASVGLDVSHSIVDMHHDLAVTDAVLERWFAPRPTSYRGRLARWLSDEQLEVLKTTLERKLAHRTLPWSGRAVCIVGRARLSPDVPLATQEASRD